MKKIFVFLLALSLFLGGCSTDKNDTSTENTDTDIVTEAEMTTKETEKAETVYYVRRYAEPKEEELRLGIFEYKDLDAARLYVDDPYNAALGYAVYDEDGNFVYGKYSEFVTKLLGEAKHVADFMKMKQYAYGDAKTNPGVTYERFLEGSQLREKIVSCDRFVGWTLYNLGYKDQPINSGLFVWNNGSVHDMNTYLEGKGFEKIENARQLQAGDIVFVIPATSSSGKTYPAHVFLCAGKSSDGKFYRYDAGSRNRIRCENVPNFGADYSAYNTSGQPFNETITSFMHAYRYVENVSELPSA